jgi:MSHA biogenesis protein MshP
MNPVSRHSGFSLITAIFLIVVVAGLGVFMVTISSVQQQTSSLSILSSRALLAADSGMQWAMRRVTRDAAAGLNCPAAPATGQASFTISGGAISGYGVTVTCSVQNFTENPDNYDVYNLTSRAGRGTLGSPDYHSRTVRASITTAP